MSDSFCSLADLFADSSRDSLCFGYADTTRLSFGSFRAGVARLARVFRQRPENSWCLVAQDTHLFAQCFFALLYSGKKILLPPNAKRGMLEELSGNFEAIATDEQHLLEQGFATVFLPEYVSLPSLSVDGSSDLIPPGESLSSADCEVIVFTSGSTGDIKAVHKTLVHFDAEVAALELQWGACLSDGLVLSTVCHQHIYGLLFAVLWPLAAGRPIFNRAVYYPEAVASILSRHRGEEGQAKNILVSSPAHLSRIPEYLDLAPYRESCARIFSSGGPCARETVADLWKRGALEVTEVFGSTETGGVAARVQENGRVSSNGKDYWAPLPGVEVSSKDGLLAVCSPFVSEDSELENSCFVMGDSVELSDDGRFRVLGRADRIVKVEERRFSPAEMESLLCSHPHVAEASVQILESERGSLGVRDIVAVLLVPSKEGWDVYSRTSRQSFLAELKTLLAGRFEGVLLPKRWRIAHAIPLSPQGKRVAAEIRVLCAAPIASRCEPETLSIDFRRAELRLEIRAPADLRVLSGHFPGFPVVPGYLLVEWSLDSFRRFFQHEAEAQRFESVKFRRMLLPNERCVLELRYSRGATRFEFTYRDGDGVLCSGRVVLRPVSSDNREESEIREEEDVRAEGEERKEEVPVLPKEYHSEERARE